MEIEKHLSKDLEHVPQTSNSDPVIDARLASHTNSALRKEPRKLSAELLIELARDMPDEQRAGLYLLLDSASYQRLMGNHELIVLMDPATRIERVLNGFLGVLLGMDVLTDAYKHPEEKILPANRVIVMAGDMSEGRACDLID